MQLLALLQSKLVVAYRTPIIEVSSPLKLKDYTTLALVPQLKVPFITPLELGSLKSFNWIDKLRLVALMEATIYSGTVGN